ncbi:MAG: carbohydrate ABC transporter permease [Armatimonadota bacterium]|nr:carbohydrate ABC transporter permease [Armatimonadota bacterium]
MSRPRLVGRPLFHILLVAYSVFTFAPFLWLVSSSFQTQADLLGGSITVIPLRPTGEHYIRLFTSSRDPEFQTATFLLATRNSFLVAMATTLVSMMLGTPAAYAFARLRFWGSRPLLLSSLALQLLPSIAVVIPLFLIMRSLGLINTRIGLTAAYTVFSLPFVIWIMHGYFQTIPRELEDAARIDGCTRVGALRRITLPLAAPGLAATAVFVFFGAWDEFLYALILTTSYASKTLPIALAEFIGRFTIDWGAMTSGAVIASLPPVIMALLFQRYLVTGLTSGGLR